MYLILDIESKPRPSLVDMFTESIKAPKNIKDEEKIKANIEEQKKGARKDMAIDTDYSEIICIGVREIGGESKHITLEEFDELARQCDKGEITFITYNGKNFDIPILIRELLRAGLTKNVKFLNSLRNKYNIRTYHLDLIEELNNYGKWKSLDELYRIYAGSGKEHIDFDTATEEEVKEHNFECLEATEKLFNFFKPML